MTLDPRSVIVGVAVALLSVGLVGWQQQPAAPMQLPKLTPRQELERQIARRSAEGERLAREVPIVLAGATSGGFILVIDSGGFGTIVREDGSTVAVNGNGFRSDLMLDSLIKGLLAMPPDDPAPQVPKSKFNP